jgi:hypothetical protein
MRNGTVGLRGVVTMALTSGKALNWYGGDLAAVWLDNVGWDKAAVTAQSAQERTFSAKADTRPGAPAWR